MQRFMLRRGLRREVRLCKRAGRERDAGSTLVVRLRSAFDSAGARALGEPLIAAQRRLLRSLTTSNGLGGVHAQHVLIASSAVPYRDARPRVRAPKISIRTFWRWVAIENIVSKG